MPDDIIADLLPVGCGIDICDGIDNTSLPKGSVGIPIIGMSICDRD